MKPIVYIETSTQLQKCDSWQNGRITIVYWWLSERMNCVCSRPLKSYILFSEKWRSKQSKSLHKLTDRWQHSWRHYFLIIANKKVIYLHFRKFFSYLLILLSFSKSQGPMGMRGDSGPVGPVGKAGHPVSVTHRGTHHSLIWQFPTSHSSSPLKSLFTNVGLVVFFSGENFGAF